MNVRTVTQAGKDKLNTLRPQRPASSTEALVPSRAPVKPTRPFAILASILAIFVLGNETVPTARAVEPGRPARSDRVIVVPKNPADAPALEDWTSARGIKSLHSHPALGGIRVLHVPSASSADEVIRQLEASGLVECAEPDYLVAASRAPNDPAYQDGRAWALNSVLTTGTRSSVIDAPAAWSIVSESPTVIVAVVDSGIRYTHEDLAGNMWTNPSEVAGNGLDDDHNGYVDDVYGLNTVANNGDPMDDVGHGTHVAGILGAVGNNGKGSAGVTWTVQLMALKFLDSNGEGAISDAITCIDYARAHGANLINASWGGSGLSRSLQRALERLRAAGILFVTAAGNDGMNRDTSADYPASFALDNVVVVAATDRSDRLASFSAYGSATVDLAAPGVDIFSAWHTADSAYATADGTSMAAPYVTGVFALLKARFPLKTYGELIQAVLTGVDSCATLSGKTVSGGRLNALGALHALGATASASLQLVKATDSGVASWTLVLSGAPAQTFRIEESTDLVSWSTRVTAMSNAEGSLTVTISLDDVRGRFFRAATDE